MLKELQSKNWTKPSTWAHTVYLWTTQKTPPEIKIRYTLAKMEKYIPNTRRCHNCQKYGHLKEACTRKPVCVKCGEHEPDPTEDMYTNNLNCNENHRTDSKLCQI